LKKGGERGGGLLGGRVWGLESEGLEWKINLQGFENLEGFKSMEYGLMWL